MKRLNFSGLLEPSRISAVEVQQLVDGTHLMHHIALVRKGNHLEVKSMHSSMTSLQQFTEVISKGEPVVLVMTGKGVLVRHNTTLQDVHDEGLIKSVFPDARAEDFFISRENMAENGSVFSLTRTNLAESMAKKFLTQNIQITELLIGPLSVTRILPLLDPANSPVSTGQYSFYHKNGQLTDVQQQEIEAPVDVNVGKLILPGIMLVSFAAAFDFMINNRWEPTTKVIMIREKAKEMRIQAKVKGGIAISLGTLFLVLLGNFLLYDHYQHKYIQQASIVDGNLLIAKRTDSLQELILQREQFLKQFSGTGNRKGSFIIDRIGASMPDGITLTAIVVHPVQFKEDEVNKEPVYQPRTIRIHAIVKESNALNRWIKQLEGIDWIQSVSFSDYREKEEHEAGVTVEITMK
jgi:Tfp pilus assembly protein PilN